MHLVIYEERLGLSGDVLLLGSVLFVFVIASTLLVGRQEGDAACKITVPCIRGGFSAEAI